MVYVVLDTAKDAEGCLRVRVGFGDTEKQASDETTALHVNDFRFNCTLWPATDTILVPHDPKTGLEVPADQVLKGVEYDRQPVEQTPDVLAYITAKIEDYLARLKASPTKLLTDGRDRQVATKTDPYLQKAEIQAIATLKGSAD